MSERAIRQPRLIGQLMRFPPVRRLIYQQAEKAAVDAFRRHLKGSAGLTGSSDYDTPYPNPNDLTRRKGLVIYEEMARFDDMCRAASAYLLLSTISAGWEMQAASTDPQDVMAADWQTAQLEGLQKSPNQLLLDTLDGVPKGFSLQEIVWGEQLTQGEFVGKQPIAEVVAKPQSSIEFKVDSFGSVEKDGVWQCDPSSIAIYKKADLATVLYFCFWPQTDDPYGSPTYSTAYRWYFLKDVAVRHWGRHMEQFGLPFLIGKMDADEDSADRGRFLEYLNELTKNLRTVMPPDWMVEFKEANPSTVGTFEQAIRVCNRAIARSQYLPALVMEHEQFGSLAATKDASGGQFGWMQAYVAAEAEHAIQRQIVRRSHEHNFPYAAEPKFVIHSTKEDDLLLRAQIYEILSRIGLPFSEPAIREEFGVRGIEAGEAVLLGPGGAALTEGYKYPGATEKDVAAYTDFVTSWAQGRLGPPKTYFLGQPYAGDRENSPQATGERHDHASKKNDRPLTPLEQEHDFAANNREEDLAVEDTRRLAGLAFEAILNDLGDQAGKEPGARRPR